MLSSDTLFPSKICFVELSCVKYLIGGLEKNVAQKRHLVKNRNFGQK